MVKTGFWIRHCNTILILDVRQECFYVSFNQTRKVRRNLNMNMRCERKVIS